MDASVCQRIKPFDKFCARLCAESRHRYEEGSVDIDMRSGRGDQASKALDVVVDCLLLSRDDIL